MRALVNSSFQVKEHMTQAMWKKNKLNFDITHKKLQRTSSEKETQIVKKWLKKKRQIAYSQSKKTFR